MADSTHLQQAQLATLLGPDPAPFQTLISHLMSSANEQRSQAELLFNLCKQTDPDSLSLKLAHLLQFSPAAEARAMSAILLRKQLTRDDSYLWPRLNPTTQSTLKTILLACIQQEDTKSISKKLCDTISELASGILPDNGWPELLPFMFQCVSSDSPKLQEAAFLIFAQLSQYIGDIMVPHIKELHAVFLHSLGNSPSPDVKIAALNAVINFIQCLTSSADRDRFQDLLPAMMKTLMEALNNGNEATAQDALELLIELAGTEPRFLRRQIVEVVGAMLQIAEADSLEEATRHLAIEFVITLAEARERAPGMMRKLPQFISRLFSILMKMLLDIEDEPAWHAAESEDEDAGETANYSVGQECLDRLAISLGGNTIVPVASEQLPAYLAAPEWQKHHAALIALAQIAEGCAKVMIKNLEQVVAMVLNSFQDPHPRVRWAAINAIGQLSTDLGPDLQVQYHQRVLPALAGAMDDFQNPRVQAHAASAVLNFSENCTPDILTPYLDGVVSKLLVLLQNGKQMVQEGALTALASVADSSQEHFQKYYDAVMPYLKAILVNATDKSNRMLRAKSMECISLVGMAVGKEKFREDAKQVMEVLMALQGSHMETDDPTTSYMLQAWARLCKCLGQDFLPYMSVVMPPLLQSAQLKPDVTITSADDENDIDDSDDDSMETITLGDKRIGIKTSVLEEKATACNMLCCYADELKEGFFPWIDQVAPTLVPLLKFYFHEEVRKAAVSAMPELLRSAKLAIEKGQAQGRNETYIKQLSDYIVPALVEALHKEPDTEICANILDALNECLQTSGPLLDESHVRSIVEEIKQVITASSNRKRERARRTKAEDFDAEEQELIKEKNEQEEEIFDQVGEIIGTLIKTFKATFLPFFDELASYLTPMWGETQDFLFIATERYKFCVLQWDAEASELITREIEMEGSRGGWENRSRDYPGARFSGRNVRYKHLARDYKVEQKVFILEVEDKSLGGKICLTERTRYKGFQISFDLGCASWLCAQIKSVVTGSAQNFFRRYRGHNYQFWVERFNNKNGSVLVLSMIDSLGMARKIFVPKGANFFGWRKMEEFLSEILRGGKKGGVASGHSSLSKRFVRKEAAKPTWSPSGVVPQLSFKDAVLGGNLLPSSKQAANAAAVFGGNPIPSTVSSVYAGVRPQLEEIQTRKSLSPVSLDWGSVIVCERFVVHQPWREVEASFQKSLGKIVRLVPFLCNKALLVCENVEEAALIAHLGVLPMIGFPDIVLSGWWDSIKPSERKVVSYGGWIVLEGLPPHLWTRDFFLVIGDACGGLEAIDRKTANLDFLLEAKIKIKQNSTGFIPEFVEVADGDFIFKIRIRQISPARRLVDSRHRISSPSPSTDVPKTLQITGISPPLSVISCSGLRPRHTDISRDCVLSEVPPSPIICDFGRKQDGLSNEKVSGGGRSKDLEDVGRLKYDACSGFLKLSEGDGGLPVGTHTQEEKGEISNAGHFLIQSNIVSSGDCGPSFCSDGGFYFAIEMAGKVSGVCGPPFEPLSNVNFGRSLGPGPPGNVVGLTQLGAFPRSPLGPFSFNLSRQTFLNLIGPEAALLPLIQLEGPTLPVMMSPEPSFSRAPAVGSDLVPSGSFPKFFAKFGDPAFDAKRFNQLFPSDFGSRRDPLVAASPMLSEASNLQFLDEVSDLDVDSNLVLGSHDLSSPPDALMSDSIAGNLSSSQFFSTVDFDYLSHVSPVQDVAWSQVPDSEDNLGESPHEILASLDPIECGEGILQKLFAVSDRESPKAVEVDYSADVEAVDQTNFKDSVVKKKMLKYCRRKRSSRASVYGESSGRSSEFLSNMKISLLPLKRTLFPGMSSGRRAVCGESRKNKRGSANFNEDN